MDLKVLEKLLPSNIYDEFKQTVLPGVIYWLWYNVRVERNLLDIAWDDLLRVALISYLVGMATNSISRAIFQEIGNYFSNLVVKGRNLTEYQILKILEFYRDNNSVLQTNYQKDGSRIILSIQLVIYLLISIIYFGFTSGFGEIQIYELLIASIVFLIGVYWDMKSLIQSTESYLILKSYIESREKLTENDLP